MRVCESGKLWRSHSVMAEKDVLPVELAARMEGRG